MHMGHQQARRHLLLAHSQLVGVAFFGGATQDQLLEFVRTGNLELDGGPPADGETMEYDQDALRQAIISSNGALGILKD